MDARTPPSSAGQAPRPGSRRRAAGTPTAAIAAPVATRCGPGAIPAAAASAPFAAPAMRADAVGGVQRGHDRAAQSLLDLGTVHVHRDVERSRGRAQTREGQPEREHVRREAGQRDRQGHGDHAAGGEPPAATGRSDPAGQRLREQGAHRQAEQCQPQGAGPQAEVVPDGGDVRRPRGDRRPVEEEDGRQAPRAPSGTPVLRAAVSSRGARAGFLAREGGAVAEAISTCANSPGLARPAKFTVLLCLMRPRSRAASVRDGPSTSTSIVRPTKRCARSVACRWTDSTSRSMRSRFTSCDTWPAGVAASAPRRGERRT